MEFPHSTASAAPTTTAQAALAASPRGEGGELGRRVGAVLPETNSAGLEARDLSMVYERVVGRDLIRTHALKDVSFRVDPREFVAIIGPSGCGKSTVLKLIGGLIKPTAGEIRIGDETVTRPGDNCAMVFQTPGLLPWKTVIANVEVALSFAGLGRAERKERAAVYVDKVGLADFRDHYPHELSGGMQQRVGIARALAVEPEVLLMDEPFGALDAISRSRMQDELLDIWEQTQKTVVFITHAIDEAVLLADRVLVMGQGEIVREVPVPIQRPRSRHALLAEPRAVALMRELEDFLESTYSEEDE
jgi:NitT/TauT family transport system ATP-binding protein